MTTGRVLSRGQVTLPQSIRRAAGFEPGDLLSFRVTAPGAVEVIRLPHLSLEESFERYRITVPVDGDRDWREWEAVAADEVEAANAGDR
jgi:hypothetical protein